MRKTLPELDLRSDLGARLFLLRRENIDKRTVYAIGDIHGCYEQLINLFRLIVLDIANKRKEKSATLIFCGDYVDRGPHSAQVIDGLNWLKRNSPYEVFFLKGNHDANFLRYLKDPLASRAWLAVGGDSTMRSYGVQPPTSDAPDSRHFKARDDLLEVMPLSHLTFLEQLELNQLIGDYAFAHAGIRPHKSLAEQTEEDLLWIRDGFLDHDEKMEKIIVHGHTWTSERPMVRDNRIGIDTGAYHTGVLSAVCIEDGRISFLQANHNELV